MEESCRQCDCSKVEKSKVSGPEIIEVDRTIENTTAIIWMAATGAKQVKFDSVGSMIKVTKSEINDLKGARYLFEGHVSSANDLLYGIRFTVPVSRFRLYLRQRDGNRVRMIINSEESIVARGMGVKSLTFKTPIILYYGYHVCLSYSFQSGEDISACFDTTTIYTDYKVLHPCYTLGIVQHEFKNFEKAEFDLECSTVYAGNLSLTISTRIDPKWFDQSDPSQ